MFGKNEIAGKMYDIEGQLVVNDIFYTFQGEGPDAGRPAVFVRLAKCNLRCFFCDTEFESGTSLSALETFNRINKVMPGTCELVVITGGEPLLQNIIPLVALLNVRRNVSVAVETAGTVHNEHLSSWFDRARRIHGNIIVCSPKTPKISPTIAMLTGAFKYIVRVGDTDPDDGLPNMSTQIPGQSARIARPTIVPCPPVYVQAMDEQDAAKNLANVELAASIVLKFGYRLSVQTHKIAGVP